MTPGARVSAAIEVLTHFAETYVPVDQLLREWARRSRFAGVRDRASVAEHVYAALRRRSEAAYWAGDDSPRALMLGRLRLMGLTAEDIGTLFSGEGYAPAVLTPAEVEVLSKDKPEPDHDMRLNCPMWLANKVKPLFEADFDAEVQALNERAPVDLRVNTILRSRPQVQTVLADAGVETWPTPLSPRGLRIEPPQEGQKPINVKGLKAFEDGWVDIQDEASQIVSLLAGAKPEGQVVDLCAGGGGKTLALAAEMKNTGQIYACDVNAKRLMAGRPRAERAKLRNVQFRLLDAWMSGDETDAALDDLKGKIDLVFVDAPCSGSGAWRRQPDAKWRLTRERLEGYKALQMNTLNRAARLPKEGGRIAYVTCSVFPEENENQAFAFLDAHPDYEAAPVSGEALDDAPNWRQTGIGVQLTPASTGTDGFYMAVFRRKR